MGDETTNIACECGKGTYWAQSDVHLPRCPLHGTDAEDAANVAVGEKAEHPVSCKEYEHHATTQSEASRGEHPAMQDGGGGRGPHDGATSASVGGGQPGGLRRRSGVRDGGRGAAHAEPVPELDTDSSTAPARYFRFPDLLNSQRAHLSAYPFDGDDVTDKVELLRAYSGQLEDDIVDLQTEVERLRGVVDELAEALRSPEFIGWRTDMECGRVRELLARVDQLREARATQPDLTGWPEHDQGAGCAKCDEKHEAMQERATQNQEVNIWTDDEAAALEQMQGATQNQEERDV